MLIYTSDFDRLKYNKPYLTGNANSYWIKCLSVYSSLVLLQVIYSIRQIRPKLNRRWKCVSLLFDFFDSIQALWISHYCENFLGNGSNFGSWKMSFSIIKSVEASSATESSYEGGGEQISGSMS